MVNRTLQLSIFFFMSLFFIFSGYSYTNVSSCADDPNSAGEWRLNQSINTTGSCLGILDNNIVLDCQNFNISGSGGVSSGIYSSYLSNVTIKNCNIDNFFRGIHFAGISNSIVSNVNVYDTTYGILLEESSTSNSISNVFIKNSTSFGIYFYGSSDNYNNISNAILRDSLRGATISGNNTYITNVTAINNSDVGVAIYGYYVNFVDSIISGNNNGIRITSAYCTLSNLTLSNNSVSGIDFNNAKHNTISLSTITNNTRGLYFYDGSINNTIDRNTVLNNTGWNTFFEFFSSSPVNNTFFRNYLGSGIETGGDSISGNSFNNSFWGNYWNDFGTCNLASNIGGYHVCTNPANYTVNGSTYDYKPLVNINYRTNLTTRVVDPNPTEGISFTIAANYTALDINVSGVGLNRNEIGRVIWNSSISGGNVGFIDCFESGIQNCPVLTEHNDIYTYYPNGTLIKRTQQSGQSINGLAIGDFDDDGFIDEFVTVDQTGQVITYNRTGGIIWNTGDIGAPISSVTVGDYDRDGINDDIAIGKGGYSTPRIIVYNTSDGNTWTQMWNYSNYLETSNYETETCDIDKDGFDDIVTSNEGQLIWGFNGLTGNQFFNVTGIGFVYGITCVDLDSDNYNDEFLQLGNGIVTAYEWNGTMNSNYGTGDRLWESNYDRVYEAELVDYDNDGFEDEIVYVFGDTSSNYGIVVLNSSGGEIWNLTLTDVGREWSLEIGDVNFDGIDDIIFGGADGIVYAYNLSGVQLFSFEYPQNSYDVGGQFGSSGGIEVGDVNGDALNDIAVDMNPFSILQDVSCSLSLDTGDNYNMSWNISTWQWEADVNVSIGGNHSYNVTCQKNGYQSQTISSSVWVDYATDLSVGGNYSGLFAYGPAGFFTANFTTLYTNVSELGITSKTISPIIWDMDTGGGSSENTLEMIDCELSGVRDCIAAGIHGDVFVYYNNGTLKYSNNYPSWIFEIEVGDFDNDGFFNEFALLHDADTLLIYNESGLVWESFELDGNSSSDGKSSAVAIGDLDGDGIKDDIVVDSGNNGENHLIAFTTNDGKTWTNIWNSTQFLLTYYVKEAEFGDFDRDGFEDDVMFAEGINGGNSFLALRNNGSLLFNGTTDRPYGLAVADLDHDNIKDEIVVAGERGWVYAIEWNDVVGTNQYTTFWSYDTDGRREGEAIPIDLDNDGFEDEVLVSDGGNVAEGYETLWAFNESGGVIWNYTLPTDGSWGTIMNVFVSDINRDSESEIIFSSYDFSSIYALNETGNLLWQCQLGAPGFAFGMGNQDSSGIDGNVDFNSDEINDIVVSADNGYLYILQDVSCYASFNFTSITYPLYWNISTSQFELRYQFLESGNFSYNITCQKNGYQPQTSGNYQFFVEPSPIRYIYPTPHHGSKISTSDNITFKVTDGGLTDLVNCYINISSNSYAMNYSGGNCTYTMTSLPSVKTDITFIACFNNNITCLERRTFTYYPTIGDINATPGFGFYSAIVVLVLLILGGFRRK